MARHSSGRTVPAFLLALGVGFIGGVAAWWLPARNASNEAGTPAANPPTATPARARRTAAPAVNQTGWLKGLLPIEAENAVSRAEEQDCDFVFVAGDARQPSPTGSLIVLSGPVDPDGASFMDLDEAAWDRALSEGERVWAVARNDGFVMVRSNRSPEEIRAAMARGDFYASTGVLLSRLDYQEGRLELEVAPANPGDHQFVFIGKGGEFLGQSRGRKARFDLDYAPAGYVRAVVTDGTGRKAWTQPVTVHGS